MIVLPNGSSQPLLLYSAHLLQVPLVTPKEKSPPEENKFAVVLKSPEHLLPEGLEDSFVDCSKIASFPEVHDSF